MDSCAETGGEIETGTLACMGCRHDYPIVDAIPRFVNSESYAHTFGFQWRLFRRTQMDSHTGLPISRQRFLSFTGWSVEDLRGKLLLDAGCGAGRFAEVALDCGAEVVAVDYSGAVDACRQNLGSHRLFHVVQADVYRLPLRPGSFDFVYSFGMLQHTPDVEKAFLALPQQLKEGGQLAVDVYPKLWRNVLWPKYWLRPFTRRLSAPALLRLSTFLVRLLLPLSNAIGRIPMAGRKLRYLLPVVNYQGVYPLSEAQQREWSVLDTFDMLSPAHDHPQSSATVKRWFEKAGLKQIHIERKGFLVGRGAK